MAPPSNRPKFSKVLAKAAGGVANLSVLGIAGVAAAALLSWPIAALGGATYAAMVAWDAANPSFWKKTFATGSAPPELPNPAKIKDPATREAVIAIRAAQAELQKVLAETPESVKQHLGAAETAIIELEGRAAQLVVRSEDLSLYLATVKPDAVRADMEKLAAQAMRSRDASAREGFERARAQREEQLKVLDDIEAAKERAVANLSRVVATIEGLGPKIVRMRALDAQAMDDLSGSVNEELERMNGEIRVFEDTLRTLAEVAGA